MSFYSGVAAENQVTLLSLGGLSKSALNSIEGMLVPYFLIFLGLILHRDKKQNHTSKVIQ